MTPRPTATTGRRFDAFVAGALAAVFPCVLGAQRITIGPTVTISADAPTEPHGESFLAINPKNPNNLLAATNVVRKTGAGTSAYVSHDAGKSWARVKLPDSARRIPETWDVISYFDAEGNAYYGGMYYGPYHKVNYGAGLWITHSTDEGRTWSAGALLPGGQFFDRPYMAFNGTGPFPGRTYAGGRMFVTRIDGRRSGALAVAFSNDSAATFGQPRIITSTPDEDISNLASMVVTSDGTVLLPFITGKPRPTATTPRPAADGPPAVREQALRIATSSDGGNSYVVSPQVLHYRQLGNRGHGLPSTAIDKSSGPFRDRLYFLREEDTEAGTNIVVNSSSDNGKTWSKPVVVNDNRTPANHVNPTIAVDGRGVVGVAWNDRRGHKDGCYDLYFTASLDGGETFLPNVTPGGKPTCPTAIPNGGETQGLVGGAGGVFHAAWIDGSSGVTLLAATTFTVPGSVSVPARR
jgi:hypothetical protein